MKSANPNTKKIVVIDDEKSMVDFLREVLRRDGFQVVTVQSAKDAKAIIESTKPDLIVVDLVMPGMSGVELIHYLQEKGMQSIPVIVITGHNRSLDDEEKIRLEANVVDIIKKPFQPSILMMRVRQLLKTNPEGYPQSR